MSDPVLIPYRLSNTVGNWPDADKFMANFDLLTALARGNFITNGGLETWSGATSFADPADGTAITTGWAIEKGGTTAAVANVAREATIIDSGVYSGKIDITTGGSSDSYVRMKQVNANFVKFRGQTVVFGFRVRAGVASKVRLSATDGVSTAYSSYHTGSGLFETLYVTLAVDAAASELTLRLAITSDFVDAVYFDGAYLFVVPALMGTAAKAALAYSPTDDI